MELAKRIVLDIVSTSQSVICAAAEYADRRKFKNVQSCHFRLENEMHKISVTANGILDVLANFSPNGPPLDERLQDWFSSDELPTCLDTLHQMESKLRDDTWVNAIFNFVNTVRSSHQENKIDAAVKLFESRRDRFHFLLTTDVWNCEDTRQKTPPRACCTHAQAGPFLQGALESNTNAVELEVDQDSASSTLGTAKITSMNTSSIILAKEKKRIDSIWKLDEILKWLNGLSCTAKQEETLSLRQPDTCTWLHSTPEYMAWRNSDSPSLWLQGKPGSGKTVLASFVIDSLNNTRRSGEALAFFYCDFRNDRSTSAAEVMRSLLSQLLRQLYGGNTEPGELVHSLFRERNGDAPILENVKRLAAFVRETSVQFTQQPVVIVDALDECKDVEKLLGGLLTLAKGGLRLFITSRPLPIIKDVLRGLPSLSMDKVTTAVSADIALHVARELDSRRRLRDLSVSFKMEIHTMLCSRADGMFRWVQCQIDTLNRCVTRAEVREALDNLPIGLDETYERILVAIDLGSPEGKLALRALVWLVGALRPLRTVEILEGLTIDLGKRIMDPETGPMHRGALLDACGSLVTHNEETDILILSHFSVKEYLTGDLTRIKLPRYHISYQSSHEHLARICICYIALYLKHVHASDENTSQLRIMRTINGQCYDTTMDLSLFPGKEPAVSSMSQGFLGYIINDGFNHLAHLGSANHVLKDMVILQSDIQCRPAAWETIRRMSLRHMHPDSVPLPGSEHDFMFYVLTAFASHSLLHAFLGPSRRILVSKYLTNPLVYAAHFGRPEHARLLLSRGAKVNEKGLIVEAYRQALPLEVAVSRQHALIVELLLAAGSVVPRHLFPRAADRNFPIRIARRLVQTDEFIEWAAEPGNRLPSPAGLLERRLPLSYEGDIIIMIRRLVQVGLDPAARNSAGKSPIHLASTGGYQAVAVYLSMVRLVVDPRFDIAVCDEDTALHLAIRSLEQDQCLQAVKLFVGVGCDPFAYNEAHETPFRLALEKGYPSVVHYLLSQETPPREALSDVIESRCPMALRLETIRALVDAGSDVHAFTTQGESLLHRTARLLSANDGLETAKFLVDTGCDPFRNNAQGETPLDLALCDYSPLLANFLLSLVKSPPGDILFAILHSHFPDDWRAQTVCALVAKVADVGGVFFPDNGNTLLHVAVLALDEPRGLDVIKALVGAGCNPFQCNTNGKTPLHIALDCNFPLIVDYLLSIEKPLPPDSLFAILRSPLPAAWRARTVCSLIAKGADAHGFSDDGNTLLHIAVLTLDERHGLDVAKLLVDIGCDPSKCNKRGETPFDLSLDHNSPLVTEYLLRVSLVRSPFFVFIVLRHRLTRMRELYNYLTVT